MTTPKMRETPLTDGQCEDARNIDLWIATGKHGYTEANAEVVLAEFARGLERLLDRAMSIVEIVAEEGEGFYRDGDHLIHDGPDHMDKQEAIAIVAARAALGEG